MPKHRKVIVCMVSLAVFLGTVLLWWGFMNDFRFSRLGDLAFHLRPPSKTPSGGETASGRMDDETSKGGARRLAVPKGSLPGDGMPDALAPAPPLPHVAPESTQQERREAFKLRDSVDHIVQKDEPFELGDRKWTIGEIEKRVHGEAQPERLFPSIRERELGAFVREPIAAATSRPAQAPAYYGVRLVRPGENLWSIHYAIIREHLAWRSIILPVNADKPHADGRSSGVGRLLKFIEGVVHIYNFDQNRMESDRNLIHPHTILVFFRISDLLTALNQLEPEDLHRLRYVKSTLRLERAEEVTELLDQRSFMNGSEGD